MPRVHLFGMPNRWARNAIIDGITLLDEKARRCEDRSRGTGQAVSSLEVVFAARLRNFEGKVLVRL